MKKLFLKVKPSAVLLLLKDAQQLWYPSKLARSSNSSYVHTTNLLANLVSLGLVECEKKGKQNNYRLTEKGAVLAQSLDEFSKKCDVIEQEARQQKAEPPPTPPAESQAQKQEKAQQGEKKA